MLTTRRSRFSRPGPARPRLAGSGPTFAMIDRQEIERHPPYGSPTRPIARANIPSGISRTSPERCKPMRTPASITSTTPDASAKPHAGLMQAANSTRFTSAILHQRPRKRSSASPPCTPSRRRSAAAPRICEEKSDRQEPPRCSQACTPGLRTRSRSSRRSRTPRWRALTHYADDGTLEIDNNTAERALRVIALGRKNFLFAGSDAGGERAAAMYSLLGSAKLNGLDPEI